MATGMIFALAAATPTVVEVNPDGDEDSTVILTNNGATPVQIGGADVSATNYGYTLGVGAVLQTTIAARDKLYAFCTVAGQLAVFTSP